MHKPYIQRNIKLIKGLETKTINNIKTLNIQNVLHQQKSKLTKKKTLTS